MFCFIVYFWVSPLLFISLLFLSVYRRKIEQVAKMYRRSAEAVGFAGFAVWVADMGLVAGVICILTVG